MNFFPFCHLVLWCGGFIIPCYFLSSVLFWWNWLYFLSSYFLWAFEKYSSCFSQSGSFHPVFSYDSVLGGRRCSRHSGYLMNIWRASQVVLVVKTHLPVQETLEMWLWSLCQEDSPGEGNGNIPVSLPGKSHGQSLAGYSPWGGTESDTTEVT